VGGVGYKAALLLERFFQAIEEFVEGKSERAEFIAGIGNFEAFAEAGGAHAASLGGHIGYRGEALSGEEIAAGAGKEQSDRDDPVKGVANVLHDFFLRMEGLQDHEGDGTVFGFQEARIPAESVFFRREHFEMCQCLRLPGRVPGLETLSRQKSWD